MAQISAQIDTEAIQSLYANNSVARPAFDYFRGCPRYRPEITVNQLMAILVARGHQASYVGVRDFLRELHRLNCGVYIIGRKGKHSRLRWSVERVSLGRAAAGEPLQIEQLTNEEAAGANEEVAGGTSDLVNPEDMRLAYPLRRDRHVELVLPRDITPNEAQRLSDFIKTLRFD